MELREVTKNKEKLRKNLLELVEYTHMLRESGSTHSSIVAGVRHVGGREQAPGPLFSLNHTEPCGRSAGLGVWQKAEGQLVGRAAGAQKNKSEECY